MSDLSAKNLKLDQNLSFWFISSTHLDLCDHVKILRCLKGEGGMVEEVLVMDYLSMWSWAKLLPIAEKGDTLGELVQCKPSKIYPITKNSCQARHIWPPNQILETLAGHVWPLGQTCLASQPFPELTKHIRHLGRVLEAFPRHVRPPARTCPT
jgi:hypothetical protein